MEVKTQRLLRDGLIMSARKYPDKTAIVSEGESITYKELLEDSLRIASVLVDIGVHRGDRVAVYMENSIPSATAVYACMFAGAVFLFINPQTKTEKLYFILEDSEAKTLFADENLADNCSIPEHVGKTLETVIINGGSNKKQFSAIRTLSYDNILLENQVLDDPVFLIPNDLAAFIYTSGSTGFPKGVMQTNLAMVFAAASIAEYLKISQDDKILLVLPLAFDYGLYQLLMSVNLGACLVMEKSFTYPGRIYATIREQKVTVFPGVPTIFATMVSSYKKSGISFSSVTRVTNTAAALPEEFLSHMRGIFPEALIFKMYGLTECKRVAYLDPALLDVKPGSVGKAIPGTEVFILRPDGSSALPNEAGILHVRGPHVMAGYWKRPEQTERMLRPGPVPGEKMLCTQDLMRMDEDGFLYFVGRTDDIIKTRGEKVSPVEIETAIYSLESVKEVVVLGYPDKLLGEGIRAFVVPIEGEKITIPEIKQVCLRKLENFMVPQDVVILDSIPVLPNGKINRKKLVLWREE